MLMSPLPSLAWYSPQLVHFDSLSRFCRTHDLTRSSMLNVRRGLASHHKGWRLSRHGAAEETDSSGALLSAKLNPKAGGSKLGRVTTHEGDDVSGALLPQKAPRQRNGNSVKESSVQRLVQERSREHEEQEQAPQQCEEGRLLSNKEEVEAHDVANPPTRSAPSGSTYGGGRQRKAPERLGATEDPRTRPLWYRKQLIAQKEAKHPGASGDDGADDHSNSDENPDGNGDGAQGHESVGSAAGGTGGEKQTKGRQRNRGAFCQEFEKPKAPAEGGRQEEMEGAEEEEEEKEEEEEEVRLVDDGTDEEDGAEEDGAEMVEEDGAELEQPGKAGVQAADGAMRRRGRSGTGRTRAAAAPSVRLRLKTTSAASATAAPGAERTSSRSSSAEPTNSTKRWRPMLAASCSMLAARSSPNL